MKKKQQLLPFDLPKIVDDFIFANCMALDTCEFKENPPPPFIDSEIRIVLRSSGKGYIHVLNRDSQTINFDLDSLEARQYVPPTDNMRRFIDDLTLLIKEYKK